jgi:hypothetical protein
MKITRISEILKVNETILSNNKEMLFDIIENIETVVLIKPKNKIIDFYSLLYTEVRNKKKYGNKFDYIGLSAYSEQEIEITIKNKHITNDEAFNILNVAILNIKNTYNKKHFISDDENETNILKFEDLSHIAKFKYISTGMRLLKGSILPEWAAKKIIHNKYTTHPEYLVINNNGSYISKNNITISDYLYDELSKYVHDLDLKNI